MGREISHYRLLEPVAEGGMGCVWKAEDLTLGRVVAVKEIRNLTHDPDADARFLREAQAVSRIDHPNVVTFYEMVDTPDQQYLVMQYVDGQSLRKKVQRGPLEASEALDIGIQVAAALEAAHAVGVVHRDLKPENVVITTNGIAKVLDFGVAHFNDRSTITRSGSLVGTVPYMAPEQVQSRPVDSRTDIYALSVLLYEMLTGKLPYQGREAGALVYEIINTTPKTLTRVRPGIPQAISNIVTQAMAKRPEDRYASATELLHDLKLARAAIGEATKHGFHFEQKQRKRAMWVAVMSAIALIAVVTAGRPVAGLLRAGAPRLIVAPWENATGAPTEEWMTSGIMDGLIRAIGSHGGMRVVSRETLAATRETIKTPKGAQGEAAAAQVAAKQLGARYLVRGTFERAEGKIRVHCDLVDVRRGTLVKTWTRVLASLEQEFHPTLNGFADAIAKEVGVRPRNGKRLEAPTKSLEALRNFQAAKQAMEASNLPDALSHARSAVAVDASYAEAHLFIATRSPDPREQKQHMTLAIAHQADAPEVIRTLIKASEFVMSGQINEAISQYEAILAQNPEDFTAGVELARLYQRARRFDDMVALCVLLHRVNPFNYSFYRDWSQAYVQIGRNDRALALMQEWRATFPEQIVPLRYLATLHEKLGNYAEGIAVCDTMEHLLPGSATELRGFLLADLGRMNEAEALFSKGLVKPDLYGPPSRSESYLAMLGYMRRDYRRGFEHAERAMTRSPDSFNIWIAGLLAASLGDSSRALELARLERQSIPVRDSIEASGARRFEHHIRGSLALATGNPQLAVQELEACLKYTSRSDGAYFKTDLGRALLAAGDAARAMSVLEDALGFNPNYPPALLYFGQASLRLGKYSQARRALDRLHELWKDADEEFLLKQQLRRLRDASEAHNPLAASVSRVRT